MSMKYQVLNRETGEVELVTPRTDPSRGGRTRQSEAAACDVNLIVKNFTRGQVPAHVTKKVASYGFVPATTYQECLNEVRKAEEVFMELPAATRAYFANDPSRFVNFTFRKENVDELIERGLLIKREDPPPVLGSAGNPIHVAPPPATEE